MAFSSAEDSMNQVVSEGMAVDVEAAARGETRGARESICAAIELAIGIATSVEWVCDSAATTSASSHRNGSE